MKKINLFSIAVLFIVSFYGCNKKIDNSALCNNKIKDGNETEIDCGGACQPCPGSATLSCTLGTTPYNSSSTTGGILGPSIRIYANNVYNNETRPLNFMFIPTAANQSLHINAVSFAYNGEAYTLEPGDSGIVVLSTLDTLRKIVSGTFWFTANRVTGPDSTSARNGIFANVRY